ncbi:MAG: hypothetical protein RLZZ292_3314 [Bacteroidota bacterium]|jgi:hypothetical protein
MTVSSTYIQKIEALTLSFESPVNAGKTLVLVEGEDDVKTYKLFSLV